MAEMEPGKQVVSIRVLWDSFHGDEEGWLGGWAYCARGTVLASSGLKDHLGLLGFLSDGFPEGDAARLLLWPELPNH